MKKKIFIIYIVIGLSYVKAFSQPSFGVPGYDLFFSLLDSTGKTVNPLTQKQFKVFIDSIVPIKCIKHIGKQEHVFVQNSIKFVDENENKKCLSKNPDPKYYLYNYSMGADVLYLMLIFQSDTMNIKIIDLYQLSEKVFQESGMGIPFPVEFYLDSIKFNKGNYTLVIPGDLKITTVERNKKNSYPIYSLPMYWLKKEE